MRSIKSLLRILVLICCITNLQMEILYVKANTSPNHIDVFKSNLSFEGAMIKANEEFRDKIGRDYFFHRIYDNETNTYVEIDANEDIWQEYGIFSTKSPSGKYKFINELQAYQDIPNNQWEFIGYNRVPEPVPNPYYTPDSVPKTQIMGRRC